MEVGPTFNLCQCVPHVLLYYFIESRLRAGSPTVFFFCWNLSSTCRPPKIRKGSCQLWKDSLGPHTCKLNSPPKWEGFRWWSTFSQWAVGSIWNSNLLFQCFRPLQFHILLWSYKYSGHTHSLGPKECQAKIANNKPRFMLCSRKAPQQTWPGTWQNQDNN